MVMTSEQMPLVEEENSILANFSKCFPYAWHHLKLPWIHVELSLAGSVVSF